VAGGSRVILCLLPISHSMEYTPFSHTRNVRWNASAYEIHSTSEWVSHDIWLHASITVMGVITYTLTFTLEGEEGSPIVEPLTWTDTILTYRSRDPLQVSLPTVARRTLRLYAARVLETDYPETGGGERSLALALIETPLWRKCEIAFHESTYCVLAHFSNFVSGDSAGWRQLMRDVDELNSWNQMY